MARACVCGWCGVLGLTDECSVARLLKGVVLREVHPFKDWSGVRVGAESVGVLERSTQREKCVLGGVVCSTRLLTFSRLFGRSA